MVIRSVRIRSERLDGQPYILKGGTAVKTCLAVIATAALLALGACSEDKTTGPGTQSRTGADLDEFAAGAFTTSTSGDFRFRFDAGDAAIDAAEVVDLGDGDMALKDADIINDVATRVTITRTDQRLFTFDALDGADLAGNIGSAPVTRITLRGHLVATQVGSDHIMPTIASPTTIAATNLAGRALSHLELEILSSGGDDLCVSFLEFTSLSAALIDFDAFPLGEFEVLNAGEFRLTWVGSGDHLSVVELDDGNRALSDADVDNDTPAAVTFTLADGGKFLFDALYAADLLVADANDTHEDSVILLEGFEGATLVASDMVYPASRTIGRFDAVNLADLELTSLTLSVTSATGIIESDDYVVDGLLVTIIE